MKQALKKNRFCKDSYYEMDDHTLKYHVLTIWKFSSREQSGWGYIQSYGGLKVAKHKNSHGISRFPAKFPEPNGFRTI